MAGSLIGALFALGALVPSFLVARQQNCGFIIPQTRRRCNPSVFPLQYMQKFVFFQRRRVAWPVL